MQCAKPDCEKEAVAEVRIRDWHPFCQEHVDLAKQISVDSAMRVGGVVMVNPLHLRELRPEGTDA